MSVSWYLRFLTSTRGRLITLLRRDAHTVEELASELHLTDNAVRAHLAALERDGLVRQCGVRRGGGAGKPAYAYELTADAEQFFPKPYATVLNELLDSLDGHINSDALAEVLRTVGKQIASEYPLGSGDTHTRLEAATEALNQLGGLAESRRARWPAPHPGLQLSPGGARARSSRGLSPRGSVREHGSRCTCTRAL